MANYPSDRFLPVGTTECRIVLDADNAFPGNPSHGNETKVLNTRLSGARVVVENIFGIMSSVFKEPQCSYRQNKQQ